MTWHDATSNSPNSGLAGAESPPYLLSTSTEASVFSELGRHGSFSSLEELRGMCTQVLMRHWKELPAEYDPMDMLVWGRRHGLVRYDEGTFRVREPNDREDADRRT